MIQIAAAEDVLTVTAGGRLLGRPEAGLEDRIRALLNDPARRARWTRWAKGGSA
ncbi:hypothetical protein [Tropicibacter naphthalenivorans]|uniref:hypothetical protein n=1 Tax=Tropicibacter naphthalenivorans TaxID=441103 RepID=UPI001F1A6CF0|nr:hypothetical protein [Tropicibacter naphthalenivorans]